MEVLGYIRDRAVEPFQHIPYENDNCAWLIRRFLDEADDLLAPEVGACWSRSVLRPSAVDTSSQCGPITASKTAH